jgi:hypothetical protein
MAETDWDRQASTDGSKYRNQSVRDDALTSYLQSIKQTLDNREIDPEDINILVENVFSEIAGRIIPVTTDRKCSLVMYLTSY